MTPAIDAARTAGICFTIHEYEHDPASSSFGLEAAEKLGVAPERVFKTLVVETSDGAMAVGIVPVDQTLNLKSMARTLGSKKVSMADPAKVERHTGYVLGGVSPLGQRRPLPTVMDRSAMDHPTILVSAGRRGLDIELAAADLMGLTNAESAAIT